MHILDKLPKPPKHKHIFNPTEKAIKELARKYDEEQETIPEGEAQLQREIDLGLHPGHR